MVDLTDSHALSGTAGGHTVIHRRVTVDTSTANKAQNAVDNLFDVYPGDTVLSIAAQVTTAEGGTLTFDVGDGSDVDGYIDGANGNATGWSTLSYTMSTGATPLKVGYWPGQVYAATDTIDVKWLNAADAAVVEFHANIIRAGT